MRKMRTTTRKPALQFAEIAAEIRRVTSVPDQLVHAACDAFEYRHVVLAQTLVDSMGSWQRWMCTDLRAFDGRSAYDILADGDEDLVWDQLPGGVQAQAGRMQKAGMA